MILEPRNFSYLILIFSYGVFQSLPGAIAYALLLFYTFRIPMLMSLLLPYLAPYYRIKRGNS
jgi:hypothetical protein